MTGRYILSRCRAAGRVPRWNCAGSSHGHVVDKCHVMDYSLRVIKTFADRRTQELFVKGNSKRCPSEIARRAVRKLEYVHLATSLDDLKVPPGNRLHQLAGDRAGQHAIALNDQWRICFKFEDGDAYDVEMTDYH